MDDYDYTSDSNYLEALYGSDYTSDPNYQEALYGSDYVTEIPNTAGEGESGYGWKYYSDGTAISPEGAYYQNGDLIYNPSAPAGASGGDWWSKIISGAGGTVASALKGLVSDSKGNISGAKIASLAGGILGGINPSWGSTQQKPVGYTGGIPQYTAVREQVPGTYDPTRRPGSRGQEYFTEVQYAKPDQVATAKATAAQEAQAAEARNKARTAEVKAAPPRQDYATGGIATLAKGRYLAGATDGMADKIPATIANQQPAKLSHGEFVIPADVVSHLGNGNSEAGAQRLYSMMDKVRQARTGTKKQGKQINPNKFIPG